MYVVWMNLGDLDFVDVNLVVVDMLNLSFVGKF